MKKVYQTITADGGEYSYIKEKGNCFEACLASILEIDITDVPDLEKFGQGRWIKAIDIFLEKHDLIMVHYYSESLPEDYDQYCIGSGKSPRGDFHHAVVCKGKEFVFDPFKGGNGIDTIESYWTFCK